MSGVSWGRLGSTLLSHSLQILTIKRGKEVQIMLYNLSLSGHLLPRRLAAIMTFIICELCTSITSSSLSSITIPWTGLQHDSTIRRRKTLILAHAGHSPLMDIKVTAAQWGSS